LIARRHWLYYKSRFRILQKENINKNAYIKKIDLEKIYNNNRNEFWKKIKRYKNKHRINVQTKVKLEQFETYYDKLFSHEGFVENDEKKSIKIKVLEEFETLKNDKFDLVFNENDIEIAIKELKINKASGNDYTVVAKSLDAV
jgi:hypothetical protein